MGYVDMSDEGFLRYCDSHSETPRCGFVPQQIAHLLRLSGREAAAQAWDAEQNYIVNCTEDAIKGLVKLARSEIDAVILA